MKRQYVTTIFSILTIVLNCTTAKAQGLKFDNNIKAKSEQLSEVSINKDIIPIRYSLESYAPYAHYQYGGTCVAHAFASLNTILMAIGKGWYDRDYISRNSFSPHFIYYRNKESADSDCSMGLDPIKTAEDIMSNGMAKLFDVECPDYYPCQEEPHLCNYYPPTWDADISNARASRFSEVFIAENIQQIKTSIFLKRPVFVGMNIPKSFFDAGALWTPLTNESLEDGFGHAMVIVAYDDMKYGGAVKLLNSWGTNWGTEGYTWVKYKDFLKFVLIALVPQPSIHFKEGTVHNIEESNEYSELEKHSKGELLEQDKTLHYNPINNNINPSSDYQRLNLKE